MAQQFSKDSKRPLDRRCLEEAWARWHMITWKVEMGLVLDSSSDIEKDIQDFLPQLRVHFTQKWSGNHHKNNCLNKGKFLEV